MFRTGRYVSSTVCYISITATVPQSFNYVTPPKSRSAPPAAQNAFLTHTPLPLPSSLHADRSMPSVIGRTSGKKLSSGSIPPVTQQHGSRNSSYTGGGGDRSSSDGASVASGPTSHLPFTSSYRTPSLGTPRLHPLPSVTAAKELPPAINTSSRPLADPTLLSPTFLDRLRPPSYSDKKTNQHAAEASERPLPPGVTKYSQGSPVGSKANSFTSGHQANGVVNSQLQQQMLQQQMMQPGMMGGTSIGSISNNSRLGMSSGGSGMGVGGFGMMGSGAYSTGQTSTGQVKMPGTVGYGGNGQRGR